MISIIIVNYNSWSVLSNCLESLFKISSKIPFEVVVVDNASPTSFLPDFKLKFPKVKWIENNGNNGFSNGCNLGAKHAEGAYLLFLNPDTIMQSGVLEHFIDIYDKENIGILSCLQKRNNHSWHKYKLLFPNPLRIFGLLRSIERSVAKKKLTSHFKETDKRCYPDWISGSLIFISKMNFDKIGGWNEDYWLYFEDVDLCKKASFYGLSRVISKEVSILHFHGGASRVNPKTKALTKTEVLISKHVYIQNYFKKGIKNIVQFVLMLYHLFSALIFFILSLLLFFVKKLSYHRLFFKYLVDYYIHVFSKKTWLSPRAINFKKRQL